MLEGSLHLTFDILTNFLVLSALSESTQTSGRGTSTLGRDKEIKKLNEEIDRLKKKLAGEVAKQF